MPVGFGVVGVVVGSDTLKPSMLMVRAGPQCWGAPLSAAYDSSVAGNMAGAARFKSDAAHGPRQKARHRTPAERSVVVRARGAARLRDARQAPPLPAVDDIGLGLPLDHALVDHDP